METSGLREDLVLIAAIARCQIVNIIAFACGILDHVAIMLLPTISILAVIAFRYLVMMVKLIIVAIKYKNHNE